MQTILLSQLCQLQPQEKLSPFLTTIYNTSLKVPEIFASFHIASVEPQKLTYMKIPLSLNVTFS